MFFFFLYLELYRISVQPLVTYNKNEDSEVVPPAANQLFCALPSHNVTKMMTWEREIRIRFKRGICLSSWPESNDRSIRSFCKMCLWSTKGQRSIPRHVLPPFSLCLWQYNASCILFHVYISAFSLCWVTVAHAHCSRPLHLWRGRDMEVLSDSFWAKMADLNSLTHPRPTMHKLGDCNSTAVIARRL